MMNENAGIVLLCCMCCLWPGIIAYLAVQIDRRVREVGWSSVLHWRKHHES